MNKKALSLSIVITMIILLLVSGCATGTGADTEGSRRTLSVILYNWIPDLEEYFGTMESEFELLYPDIDLQIISLPGYYDGLESTEADVYEVDEDGLRLLLDTERLQPFADNEIQEPGDFFPICKDVACIDDQWWGVPHWTCTYFMFYNKNDEELAAVQTFSELEQVIGGKNHPRGQGLLINLDEEYCRFYYNDTIMDLYPNDPVAYYEFQDANNINEDAVDIMTRIVNMTDPGMGRDPLSNKIFDNLQRQFIYGNGRAYVYYSEAVGYFSKVIADAESYGDATLTLEDLAIKPFVQSGTGEACQPGFVDSFCLDKSLTGQKREDAIKFITWVTSKDAVVKQVAPSPDFVRYLSPARLSVYADPELLEIAPLYEQMQPIMALARHFPPPAGWDGAPDLNPKLNQILPAK